MLTVLDVLHKATDYLAKKEVESPRLNAEHLLAHCLGMKRLEIYLAFDRPVKESELTAMREMIRTRGERIPLQHLLGNVEFFGRKFLSDSRALIPRPETEQLLEILLEKIKKEEPPQSLRCLDVGTGSGVIAITLALELPESEIIATDISPAALELAQKNASLFEIKNPIRFLEADIAPADSSPFSVIAANLPYIAESEMATLQPEVLHDPREALCGGIAGTEIIEKLIALAQEKLLTAGGILALEMGEGQPSLLKPILQNWHSCEILHDYQGKERFLFAKK